MSVARKIFSNTAWQVISRVVIALLGIVSIKLITNYLDPHTFGEYTTIYEYTAVFAIIADFGLFTIGVREMAETKEKSEVEKIMAHLVAIRLTLGVISLSIGALIARVIPAYEDSPIPIGIMVVAFSTLLTMMAGTISAVLQYHLQMQWASIAHTIGKIITVAYIVVTIFFLFPNDATRGFMHLQLGWVFGAGVSLVIILIAAQRIVHIGVRFEWRYWKEMLRKALPYGAALVLGTIYFRMGTLTLSLFSMQRDVAFIAIPSRFIEILQIIPHYFMNSVLPILTISLAAQNAEKISRIIRYSVDAMAAFILPTLVGGFLLAWNLTAAISSPEFLTQRTEHGLAFGSDMGLKIMLIAVAFTYFHVVLSYLLVAAGEQKKVLLANAIAAVVNVTLNFLIAPRFGFLGAAAVAATTEFIMLMCLIVLSRKYCTAVWDGPFLAKALLASIVMGAVIAPTSRYFDPILQTKGLAITIPLGALVYGGMLLLTKAVRKEMAALLRKGEPSS